MSSEHPDMSALEAAQLRSQKRVDPRLATKPVAVHTVADIQRLLAEFAPSAQKDTKPIRVDTVLTGEDEVGDTKNFNVSAISRTKTKRDILLDGFDVIKRYQELIAASQHHIIPIEVNGVPMDPPHLVIQDPASWVDPLVVRWMGGRRKGLRVSWILDGYEYLYDPYQHKFTRKAVEV